MSLYDITTGVNLIPDPDNIDPYIIPFQIQIAANHLSFSPGDPNNEMQLDVTGNLLLNGEQIQMNNSIGGSLILQMDPTSVQNTLIQFPLDSPVGPYQSMLTDVTGRMTWDTFYQTFQNQLDVCKNPNPLQYATITSALSALSFGDPLVPTAIFVHPGEYQEVDTIVLPSNVYVIGIGMQPVIISPGWVSPERPMFQLSGGNNGLAFVSLSGGSGNAFAVEFNDAGDYALLFKVDVTDWKNGFHANVTTVPSFIYLEYCSTNFDDVNVGNTSVYVENGNTNVFISFSVENGFFFGPCNNHLDIRGNNVDLMFSASTIQITEEFTNVPYGNAFFLRDSCETTLRGTYIEGVGNGVFVPSDSLSPNIDLLMAGVLFHDNTKNINILSNNVEGDFTGYSEYEKTIIPKESQFFITNQDNNTITVAKKGGNFSSVRAAIEWVKTTLSPSATNPFDIIVGPGNFVEDTITLVPYISLIGQNRFTSTISANVNTVPLLVGNAAASIQGLQLTGSTGSGGSLISYDGSLSLMSSFRVSDMYLGSGETMINLSSNNGVCVFTGSQIIFAPSAVFKDGLKMSGTNYAMRGIFGTLSWFPVANNATFSNFVLFESNSNVSRDVGYFSQIFGGSEAIELGGTGAIFAGNVGVALQGGAMGGFSNGIVVPSGYSTNPRLTVGVYQLGNMGNYDVFIDGANTTGFLNLNADYRKIFINDNSQDIAYVAASNVGEMAIASRFFQGPTSNTVTWISKQWHKGGVTGLIVGTLSSVFSTRTVSLTAGNGYVAINSTTPSTQYLRYVSWDSTLSVVLPASTGDYYVYVDHNSTIQQSLTKPILAENILIARARVEEVSPAVFEIVWLLDETTLALNPTTQLNDALRSLSSPLVGSGVVVNATGVGTNVNISSGSLFWGNQPIAPSQLLSPNFIAYTEDMVSSNAIGIDYSSGLPRVWSNIGVVTNLTVNEWTKHGIYLSGQDSFQQSYLVLGSNVYTSSNDALTNSAPFAPSFLNESIFHLADAVISGNTSIALSDDLILDKRPFLATGGGGSGTVPTTLDHNALLNLPVGDVHTQYLPADGSRPMTGDLNMGTNDITNAGTYNGVTVQAHASRHQPGGADPIPTDVAVTITDFTNAEGVSSFLTRSDHTHAHGVRGGGNLHAVATTIANGFMSATDKVILDAATSLRTANTIAERDATGQIQFSNVQLLNNSNFITNLVPSSLTTANYSFILPNSVGSVGQILTSNGVSGTLWTNNSVFVDPTSNVGDLLVRGSSALQSLFVPLPNTAPSGANLSYSFITSNVRFPTWSLPPYDPLSTFVEIEDFTSSVSPFTNTGYRSQVASSATLTAARPVVNPGDPLGCIRLSLPANIGIAVLTKNATSGATTSILLTSTSTVFFEIAIHADAIDQFGTTLEIGFSNNSTTASPTQMIGFLVPGSGTANIPIQAIVRNTTSATQTIATVSTNQWVVLKFILYGLTVLQTFVNGTLVPNTLSLALLPTTNISPFVRFARTIGTTRNVHIDFIRWGKFWSSRY